MKVPTTSPIGKSYAFFVSLLMYIVTFIICFRKNATNTGQTMLFFLFLFCFLFSRFKGFDHRFSCQDKLFRVRKNKTIISWFNSLFGASIGNDNLNLILILSYSPFVIFIFSFWWVRIILSWLTLKCLFCPLSIHHSCSLCSPSIDIYLFLHNSSSPSLLFDTDPTPIPTYSHFFLNLLNFLFFFLDYLFCNQVKFEKGWNKEFKNFVLLSSTKTTIFF